MDGLAAVVQERLRLDSFSGAVFVFRAKRADRVKLLVWEASGLTLIYKRLDETGFVWPRIEDGVMRLSPGQLGALLGGSTASGSTAVGCPGHSSRNDPCDRVNHQSYSGLQDASGVIHSPHEPRAGYC